MGAKAGYRRSGTPARILQILADGTPRTVRDVAFELRKTSPVIDAYGAAATALHNLAARGDIKRERINRKWTYSCKIAQGEAHG